METRPTAMYRVPWQTARQERLRRSLEKLQAPMARPAGMPDDPAPGDGSPHDVAGAPDVRWPSLTGRGPRHIPVVGPTEALRGRPGGPGVGAPPAAVPGLLDHERESGWQQAQRAWQDSGVDWEWEDTPAQADYAAPGPYAPGPYGADQYSADPYSAEAYARPFAADTYESDSYPPDTYGPDSYPSDTYGPESYPADTYGPDSYPSDTYGPESYPADADDFDADPYPAGDHSPAHQYSAAPHAASQYLTDSHPTRPDLPVLREGADSLLGMGPWPVQQPPRTPRPESQVAEPRVSAEQARPDPEERDQDGRGPEQFHRDGQAAHAAARQVAQEAPPLPRRIRRAEFASSSPFAPSAPSSPFAPCSPFAPSPAFASRPSGPAPAPDTSLASGQAPLSAPVAPVAPVAPPLGEPDELFRAWQGSVQQAVGPRTPWSARRPAGGRRGLGWQVAKIGVPAAVIVTVGAGALMMLTGRANDMLAERASTGTPSSGQASAGAVVSGQASGKATAAGQAGAGTTGLTLAGYPGAHGTVGVAALWSAGGTTMAVGYADTHPAVWRHATDGTWSLVSAAALGGLTGNLTSVAQGPSGWIAVGSMNDNGTVEPAVFSSPDGVTWTPQPALTNLTGSGAQLLGVAAGPGGYLVVGKDGGNDQAHVALWWSADLKNWVNGETSGSAGSFAAAAVAVGNGFVAAGSENNCHTIWTSPDGRNWTAHDLAKPSGATTATLGSIAVDQGGRFVAAGYVTGSSGALPIVVTSGDGGAHVTQVVLSAPQGQATVTAVTATDHGFAAVGLAGPANARHAVEWTSPDGATWSAATQVTAAGASAITALSDTGTMLTGTAQRGAIPSVLAIPSR